MYVGVGQGWRAVWKPRPPGVSRPLRVDQTSVVAEKVEGASVETGPGEGAGKGAWLGRKGWNQDQMVGDGDAVIEKGKKGNIEASIWTF